MSRQLVGSLLAVGGLLVAAVSAAADLIGLGSNPEFGTRQVAGVLLGVVALVVGVVVRRGAQGST
jgi:hypothetical protein